MGNQKAQKRFATLLVPLITLATVQIAFSATPIKPGSACTTYKQTASYQSKKFTCIKLGKKLIWDQGVVLPKPVVSPTPTPTPTPNPNPPNSFDDLFENFKGIPIAVWADVKRRMGAGKVISEFKILSGPQTIQPVEKPDILSLLNRASIIYSDIAQPKITKVFYFNYQDVSWAQSQNRLLSPPKFTDSDIAGNCKSESDCGAFGSTSQDVGAMFMGVHLKNLDPIEIYGGTEIHEFTHVVQYSMYSEQVSKNPNKYLPGWFIEGQASAIQLAGGTSNYVDYLNARQKWFLHQSGALENYSSSEILKFLDLQGVGKYDAQTWSHVYDIGCFATEAMIAVGGLSSTMVLITLVSNGETFEDAFQKIYKTSWSNARVSIAKALESEYKLSRS